ncbi:GIY-YIG nuclease family protein [Oleidesulfovibrio sp.]
MSGRLSRELGDASVPFPFDVHAMIYSEDAPALELELHRVF